MIKGVELLNNCMKDNGAGFLGAVAIILFMGVVGLVLIFIGLEHLIPKNPFDVSNSVLIVIGIICIAFAVGLSIILVHNPQSDEEGKESYEQ